MRELEQKLLDFGISESFDENDYYVSKSNYFAKNIIEAWPKWEKKNCQLNWGRIFWQNTFIKYI